MSKPYLLQQLDTVNSNLAEKATQSDLEITNTNLSSISNIKAEKTEVAVVKSQVDALVLGAVGEGNNAEVVTSHVGIRGIDYKTLYNRLNSNNEDIVKYFGLIVPFEVGGIDTTNGTENALVTRARCPYVYLYAGDVISYGTYQFTPLMYDVNKTYIQAFTKANKFTVITSNFYRLLVDGGSTDLTTIALTIKFVFDISDFTLAKAKELYNSSTTTDISIRQDNDASYTSWLDMTNRWVFKDEIEKGYYVKTLKLIANYGTVTVECWELNNGILELKHTTTSAFSDRNSKVILVDYVFTANGYVSVRSTQGIGYNTTGTIGCKRILDVVSQSILYSSLLSSSYDISAELTLERSRFITGDTLEAINEVKSMADFKTSNIYTIGVGRDYQNIQSALDDLKGIDTVNNHITLLVYPGTYPRFSMNRDANGNFNTVRYISIIGVNPYDCIVKDDTGEYSTPPFEPFTYGCIKNMQFIATHDNPPAERENAKHKAYAVHLEAGTQYILFENCKFISYQAPAVGAGLYQDATYKFKNCEMYSYTPDYGDIDNLTDYQTNYSYLCDYGAFFCHSNISDNVTNQNVILDNCRIYSQYGNKAMFIASAGNFVNCEMNVTLINNMALSYAEGSSKILMNTISGLSITPDSYGNNFTLV